MADSDAAVIDWKWRIGLVHGIGDAAFQILGGNVRRITRFIHTPDGNMILQKIGLCTAECKDTDPQFQAERLVICDADPSDNFVRNLENFWGGKPSLVMPRMLGNGPPAQPGLRRV